MQLPAIADISKSDEFTTCKRDDGRNVQSFGSQGRHEPWFVGPKGVQEIEWGATVFAGDRVYRPRP
jgi:hypothetical protein